MSIVKQALDNYAHATQKTSQNDRLQTLGASEVGQCARKIWYVKNEADPKQGIVRDAGYDDAWGARVRGSVFEDAFWVPAMRARFGERLKFAGEGQTPFTIGFLSATPDGVLIDMDPEEMRKLIGVPTDCVVVECKTSDPRTNLVEAKPQNVFQTQVQMGIVREATPYKPTHAIISYTDASWWSDVKEFIVPYDIDIYQRAKARALNVMTADRADQLQPEGWIAGGDECRYCPFTGPCGIERRNLPFEDQPVDPQFAAEIRDMALGLRACEIGRDENEAAIRMIQEDIKTRLREKGVKKIPGVVTWSAMKGRQGINTKALIEAAEAAGIDTNQFVTEGTPGDRLTISVASTNASPEAASNKRKVKT